MEKSKKPTLKLKLNRTPSVSSNGPPSAAAAAAAGSAGAGAPIMGSTVATPGAMSPLSYFPPTSAMSPPAAPSAGASTSATSNMPPPAIPATPTDGRPKIKLKFGKSQPSTPVTDNPPSRTPLPTRTPLPAKPPPTESPVWSPTTTKAGRTSKPTAKKRAKHDADADDDDTDEPIASKQPPTKKIKVANHKATKSGDARVKIFKKDKLTTRNLQRMPGSGFDSEMEDVEEKPITEEEIVLRMIDGPECDYINECLSSTPKRFPSGGMEFKLKWVDERRAVVTVKTQLFAAVLVDLPTITEATKTWDKKLVMKSADICQMLLVFKRITREEEARTAELPKVIFDGYRWPHGLTPPMHDAVHRRFRKRLHKSDILNKEQEVERLLRRDEESLKTRYEYVQERRDTLQGETPYVEMLDAEGEQDAEGEVDEDDMGMFGLEAELHAALEDGATNAEMDTEAPADAYPTPPVPNDTAAAAAGPDDANVEDDLFGGDEGSGEEDYDDEDDASDEDLDPAEKERREHIRGVHEEVKDIDRQLERLSAQLADQGNMLLRQRLIIRIKSLNEDKRLKLASIGEVPREDDDGEM